MGTPKRAPRCWTRSGPSGARSGLTGWSELKPSLWGSRATQRKKSARRWRGRSTTTGARPRWSIRPAPSPTRPRHAPGSTKNCAGRPRSGRGGHCQPRPTDRCSTASTARSRPTMSARAAWSWTVSSTSAAAIPATAPTRIAGRCGTACSPSPSHSAPRSRCCGLPRSMAPRSSTRRSRIT